MVLTLDQPPILGSTPFSFLSELDFSATGGPLMLELGDTLPLFMDTAAFLNADFFFSAPSPTAPLPVRLAII